MGEIRALRKFFSILVVFFYCIVKRRANFQIRKFGRIQIYERLAACSM
jgi:hypothetical protein